MIPMGLGMATVNAAIMFFDPLNLHGGMGTLFVEAQAGATADAVKNAADLMTILQIDWLQPIYTYTFSNGLIACLIFMGIGALLDVGYVMARPFQSIKEYIHLLQGPVLCISTMFLGLLLGVLCDANTIMDPKILPLLLLGVFSLLISGIGGIMGGYVLYFLSGGKYNPAIGIAGVSCVPTTAKVAQKLVSKVNKTAIILPEALGANIRGVITTAIIAGIYCSLLAK